MKKRIIQDFQKKYLINTYQDLQWLCITFSKGVYIDDNKIFIAAKTLNTDHIEIMLMPRNMLR